MSTIFCAEELRNALAEEFSSSAIGAFRLTSSDPLRANASVTLLEGRTIDITLSANGYSIISADAHHDSDSSSGSLTAQTSSSGLTFESIEQLLRSVSTMYEQRRQEALIAALERIVQH